MKNIISITLLSAILLSCNSTKNEQPKGAGQLEFQIEKNNNHIVVASAQSSTVAAPDINTFGIDIHDNAGTLIKSWAQYSEVPNMIDLEAGLYKITASNSNTQDAAFDAPYYLGQKNFVINVQQITSVELLCQIANVKATVVMSDSFKAFFNNPQVIVSNNDLGSLTWNDQETRDGYLKVPTLGNITVTASGTRKDNGENVSFAYQINNVAARQWHKINVNIKTSGSAGIGITIDNTLITTDLDISVPDSNEIIDNNGDTGTWDPQPGA